MWHQHSSLTRSHCLSHKHVAVPSGLPSRKSVALAMSPASPTACLDRVEAIKREPRLRQGYLSGEQGVDWTVCPTCTAPGRVTDTPRRSQAGLVAVYQAPRAASPTNLHEENQEQPVPHFTSQGRPSPSPVLSAEPRCPPPLPHDADGMQCGGGSSMPRRPAGQSCSPYNCSSSSAAAR